VDHIIDVLLARNHRRIGLVIPAAARLASNGQYEAAFRFRQAQAEGKRLISLFLPPQELQPGDFMHWVRQHELDAVITPDHKPYIWLRPPHHHGPSVAIAHTDAVDHWWPISGMDQRRDLQTRSAIDLLASECSHNRRGLPEAPLSVLIPGRWREGETVSIQPIQAA
jgi:hypothetical protein